MLPELPWALAQFFLKEAEVVVEEAAAEEEE